MSNEIAQEMRSEVSLHEIEYETLEKRLELIEMTIEEQMREELDRHNEKFCAIVREAEDELVALTNLAKSVEEAREAKIEARRELKEVAFKAIIGMSSRKRHSLEKELTIRDGGIYVYDRSQEASINDIVNCKHLFKNSGVIETGKAFDTVIGQLERIDTAGSSSWRTEKETTYEKKFEKPMFENFDFIKYSSRSSDHIIVKEDGTYENKFSLPLHHSKIENPLDYYLLDANQRELKALVCFLPELTEMLNDVKDIYDSQTENRQQAAEKIKRAAAKYLVAGAI